MQVRDIEALQTKSRNNALADGVEFIGMGYYYLLYVLTEILILLWQRLSTGAIDFELMRLITYILIVGSWPIVRNKLRAHPIYRSKGQVRAAEMGNIQIRSAFPMLIACLFIFFGITLAAQYFSRVPSYVFYTWIPVGLLSVYLFRRGRKYAEPVYRKLAIYWMSVTFLTTLLFGEQYDKVIMNGYPDTLPLRTLFLLQLLILMPAVFWVFVKGIKRYRRFVEKPVIKETR